MTAYSLFFVSMAPHDRPLLQRLKRFLPSVLHNSHHLCEHVVDLQPFSIQAALKGVMDSEFAKEVLNKTKIMKLKIYQYQSTIAYLAGYYR